MFKRPFVIIDLETSGIEPRNDQIIEVALIRYEQGKEVARTQDLIRIEEPLSDLITLITGITDADLEKDGKEKTEVLARVQKMIKGAHIVGHNINFDTGFLKAHGVELDSPGFIDTIPLAQILLPQMASYSLESLTDDLKIEHSNSHRAMADVEATLELFKLLWQEAERLPASTLTEIKELLPHSSWEGAVFFEDVMPADPGRKKSSEAPASDSATSFTNGVRVPISVDELFREGGVMAENMEHYEPRRQQSDMANGIAHAFEKGYHLICEAPTGVGKSLAYLSAAADLSIRQKSKVVVSTNTVNLQQQLYEKDVPLLQSIYEKKTGHPGVRVALLKGRSHYLCLRRFAEFKRRPRFTEEEFILMIKILVWQQLTQTGDSSDIHLSRSETLMWDFELSADGKYCSPQKCKVYGSCYLHEARKKAEEADIIIVNHALLCADLESEGGLLPEYRTLVVDEAHHFEEVATRAFGIEIKQETLSLPIKTLQAHLSELKKHSDSESIEPLLSQVSDLQERLTRFFDVVSLFTNRNVPESAFVENLLIDKVLVASEQWMNLGDSFKEVHEAIMGWLRDFQKFISFLEGKEDTHFPGRQDFTDELGQEIAAFSEHLGHLYDFFEVEEDSRTIRFITSDMTGIITMYMYPLMVGPPLEEKLYSQKSSVIFTSATLGARLKNEQNEEGDAHPFTYLRRMLGLGENFEELVLDSPFDFEKQVYVITPTDMQPLVSKNSIGEVSIFMEKLIETVGGGLLALFTSHGALQNVYLNVMKALSGKKIKVLAQRISGGRGKIMKAYMNDPRHSVLFGTNSFWEGVDIQGEALTTLVIHKLPFDVPSDPIHKVRSQMFHNGFMEYSVPRAILRFRQGFGRLIRSKKDYGVMILLDDRVMKKEYGRMFLQALPEETMIEKHSLTAVPEKVGEWLKLMKSD